MFCQSLASKLLCEMPQVPQTAFDSKSNKTTQCSVLADLILSVNSSLLYQVNIVKYGDSEILVPVLHLHTDVPTRGNIYITVEPKHDYFITITIIKVSTEKLWMPIQTCKFLNTQTACSLKSEGQQLHANIIHNPMDFLSTKTVTSRFLRPS